MKARNYVKSFLAVSLAVFIMAGCASLITVNDRALQVEDIINMANADVGAEVILRQIQVTRSRFELDTDQIIRLKKAGVDDKVIEAMVNTEQMTDHFDWEYGYSPYEYGQRFGSNWYPVSYHYPYVYPGIYPYMQPYGVYRRNDLLGRFYRYAPITRPYYWDYNKSWDSYFEPQELRRQEQEKE